MSDVKNPRLVVAGDRIIPKGLRSPEVVRSVAVIVRMASGMDYVYESDEEVRIAPDDVPVPSEQEVLDALAREAKQAGSENGQAEGGSISRKVDPSEGD